MPRHRHDSLGKDLLLDWLEPIGLAKSQERVHGEERFIDVLFTEHPPGREPTEHHRSRLGLLGEMARGVAALEVFRNPCTAHDVRTCVAKLVELHGLLLRRARRQRSALADVPLPTMWLLTPSFSAPLRRAFRVGRHPRFGRGVLTLGEGLGTHVVVVAELPCTPATLWPRLLGRGHVQARAFDELADLPQDHPLQRETARRVLRWRVEASLGPQQSDVDQELIMNTERLVKQWESRLLREGKAEGKVEGKAEGKAEGKVEGKAEGKAGAIVMILGARALAVSAEQAARVHACRDLAQLDAWLARAVGVTETEELFAAGGQ